MLLNLMVLLFANEREVYIIRLTTVVDDVMYMTFFETQSCREKLLFLTMIN